MKLEMRRFWCLIAHYRHYEYYWPPNPLDGHGIIYTCKKCGRMF